MPAEPAPAAGGAGSWWHCVVRGGGPDGSDRCHVVESGRYPDGTRIELTASEAAAAVGDDAICVVDLDGADRVRRIDLSPQVTPRAPDVWFVEFRESAARPPAVNLIAFTGHGPARGAVLDPVDVAELEVVRSDQLGAVRWYPKTGEIDQVYVQPQWRRRHVAAALLVAGGSVSVARRWPRFWGDGQRTRLGEELRNGRNWAHRAAELTHVAPPMTPGE
ncbi:MAG TPA: hypothetical protein VGN18_20015 [Jatrophihabitans sp.]|jgi:GNAT superfamily N-acetyltransferase|uniref:hypothetical protein n=1 Tax=Jatrophihabitans sp. TaxID=1932789 RepID=UPI002E05DB82|nr:hypothetical protein [Jatrophihabitans sp.]